MRFELGPVEVEVAVSVDRAAGADEKVRFWVVEAGAQGTFTQSRTRRIGLTLQPVAATADGYRNVVLSGDENVREH